MPKITIADIFRPQMPFRYPDNNHVEFERWYYANFDLHNVGADKRVYLPIFWTAYYVRHNISKTTIPTFDQALENSAWTALQKYLDSLNRKIRYYTIVQHDDGILNDISELDIKVFSMSGNKEHYKRYYPLPLIANPHKHRYDNERIYLASFIGQITHPIRQQLKDLFEKDPDVLFSTAKTSQKTYCEVMSRSTFALCPRGYGPTSFRIQEAIQYGAIPIYISDEFVEPYNVDFNGYGAKVRFEEISLLKDYMLNAKNDKDLGSNIPVKSMWDFYRYEGCKGMIDKSL